MAGLIPPIIHFTHYEGHMSSDRARNIIQWVVRNLQYRVVVWTRESVCQDAWTVLKEIFNTVVEKQNSIKKPSSEREAEFIVTPRIGDIEHCGTTLTSTLIWENAEVGLTIRALESTPAFWDFPELESVMDLTGKGAEDMIGLLVLRQYGGIYIDNTTKPRSMPMNPKIIAPKDILFARYRKGEPDFTTAVIAATKGTEKLSKLIEFCKTHFAFPLALGPDEINRHLMSDPFELEDHEWELTMKKEGAAPPLIVGADVSSTQVKLASTFQRMSLYVQDVAYEMKRELMGMSIRDYPITPIHDLSTQRVLVNLILEWFKVDEASELTPQEMIAYDFAEHSGYVFYFPEYNKRVIPISLFGGTPELKTKPRYPLGEGSIT